MQPKEWLKLVSKKPADVAGDLEMKLITVWRHFHGLRHPNPNDIKRYEEYTKGAITAEDWIALWNEPGPVAARASEKETELKRKAAVA